jgi:hypothetical protein
MNTFSKVIFAVPCFDRRSTEKYRKNAVQGKNYQFVHNTTVLLKPSFLSREKLKWNEWKNAWPTHAL